MSILQSLASCYDRMAATEGRIPPYGYSTEKVSYAVTLSLQGELKGVVPLLDTSGKDPRPTRRVVPQPVKRTSGVASNFLWDKTSYVFGVTADSTGQRLKLSRAEHEEFVAFHRDVLGSTADEGLRSFLAFLDAWQPTNFKPLDENGHILDSNVVFRLDTDQLRFLHDRPAAKAIWEGHLATRSGSLGPCLISGTRAPVARLHAQVKGVRGAKTSGASLVTFNLDAFVSHGKKQGDNAPVSERAAFAYTTVLNDLLAPNSKRRVQLGDATTVFWADAGSQSASDTEDLFGAMVRTDAEETAEVADSLKEISAGRPLSEVRPDVDERTQFHVLGLAPNGPRLSVRFWQVDSFGSFADRIVEHWRDLRLEPSPWTTPPSVYRLLYETAAQRKPANVPANLAGGLTRAILTGTRYPSTLLATIIMRMRADKSINAMRVAICKACIVRDRRLSGELEQEDVPVSLNREEKNVAYRLGRLFAVYERVQRIALGGNLNATIKDRYFSAASATPASVFPLLSRNATHHLSTLHKDQGRRGLGIWLEREIDSILAGVETEFPRTLRLEEQGRFVLGYHHQREHRKEED